MCSRDCRELFQCIVVSNLKNVTMVDMMHDLVLSILAEDFSFW
jgi:hypothetical protein